MASIQAMGAAGKPPSVERMGVGNAHALAAICRCPTGSAQKNVRISPELHKIRAKRKGLAALVFLLPA